MTRLWSASFASRPSQRLRTRARVAMLALVAGLAASNAHAIPTFAEVRDDYRSSDTTFVDRHGTPVQVLRTDPTVRRLAWTPLADVSPALRDALVHSEDRRFYEHAGVDWQAVGAAAWANLWNTRTRGASTITMQLAGLVDGDLRASSNGRSVVQKLGQAATALALERGWRKDQILEAYLNLVGYRGEAVGIGALSATLFQKYPSGLDAREAAIAAALVRAPNASAARVATRACEILRAESLGDECRGLDGYVGTLFARRDPPRLDDQPRLAPQFARLVARTTPLGPTARASVVATSLDAGLQRFARETLRTHLAELANRNVEDGAVVVLDNATGDVLAWVGSSGDLSDAAEVDHALAPRQAGSTLKPFLYELAIERRWLTAASILDDSPVDLATANGLYIPQDYDHSFKGPVSVRTALGSSLNVPAVRTLVMVTPERFHQRLRALGFTLKESGDYYGYALALGSAEVSLAQLTNAYRALARGGTGGPLRLVPAGQVASTDATAATPGAPSARPVRVVANATNDRPIGMASSSGPRTMDPAATAIVVDILADRDARAPTFGMDSVLASRTWSAVKTGTSKDMRDNWCVGFTDRYTIGVWVGNSGGQSMWDVSGTTGAAPVWQSLVGYLARRDARAGLPASAAPALPTTLVRRAIRFDRDLEAPRDELFLPGSEMTRVALGRAPAAQAAHDRTRGLIASPVDGTIVALDPDIPAGRQTLLFRTARAVDHAAWRVDGRPVGNGAEVRWSLWPGRHRLELVDANATVVDRLAFEVRGVEVRAR